MFMVIKRCKLFRKTQGHLLQFFVSGVTARTAAELVGVSRPSATLYDQKIRQIICYHVELESEEYFAGEVELDESCFTHDFLVLVFSECVAPALRLVWRLS